MARKSLAELLSNETRFGNYTVIGEGRADPKKRMARCRCDCGVIKDVSTSNLRTGRSQRCQECARKAEARATNVKHGMSFSPEYAAWSAMLQRCYNPNVANYAIYGGRGIAVCEHWRGGFDNFYADMGPRPDGHSLDRIDNSKGYAPDNCRWATPKRQSSNRAVTLKVRVGAGQVPVATLAHDAGMRPSTLAARLGGGWELGRALSEPVQNRRPMHNVFGRSMSASDIEREYGIERQRLNYWLRKGMDAESVVKKRTGKR